MKWNIERNDDSVEKIFEQSVQTCSQIRA